MCQSSIVLSGLLDKQRGFEFYSHPGIKARVMLPHLDQKDILPFSNYAIGESLHLLWLDPLRKRQKSQECSYILIKWETDTRNCNHWKKGGRLWCLVWTGPRSYQKESQRVKSPSLWKRHTTYQTERCPDWPTSKSYSRRYKSTQSSSALARLSFLIRLGQ